MAKGGRYARGRSNTPPIKRDNRHSDTEHRHLEDDTYLNDDAYLEEQAQRETTHRETVHRKQPDREIPHRETPRKQSNPLVTVLLVVLIILILLVAVLIGLIVYRTTMDRMANQVPTLPPTAATDVTANTDPVNQTTELITDPTEIVTEPTKPEGYTATNQDILNVMVIGQSYRPGEESKLSDTMILVTINKVTSTVTLTSFLRDAVVNLPPEYKGHTCGPARLNVAYNLGWKWGDTGGAMEFTGMTFERNFGVDIDYFVEIDFDAFMSVINTLGGVKIQLSQEEADYLNAELNKSLGYEAYNHRAVDPETGEPEEEILDGMSALLYARTRKALGGADSDFTRTERQRKLITAIIDQLRSRGFNTLQKFAQSLLSQITTDMSREEMISCMWEVLPVLPNLKIESRMVPEREDTYDYILKDGNGKDSHAVGFNIPKYKELVMSYAEADTIGE